MSGFSLQRLGMLMEPQAGNPHEVEGVLNPAAVRGPDGNLYLFPRLVARGNYSRIGIARVQFNAAGDPAGVERLGIALEPEAEYERRPDGSGGCEDPRITFVEPLKQYIMTYTAFSSRGPRIALAISTDLFHWRRLGLAKFGPYKGIEFDDVDDKDASLFPVVIPDPSGQPELAMLHRPLFPGTRPEETACRPETREVDIDRESIWISYCQMSLDNKPFRTGQFIFHHRLAAPVSPWERLKIGGGTPPVLTRHGWLIIYHGVSEIGKPKTDRYQLCLFGGGDDIFQGASARDSLPFGGTCVDAGAAAGTPRNRRQRRIPHWHRPARRSWLTGPLRRLLRNGRQAHWRCAP